ncbi:LOW QUALITY PROTEIN: ubiquitin-like modifier-activating enzyme 6 [Protopterus annectens]|uniref:LOW QUALITY PROTEIN: ubiquitin-like modifier-activating enzyme 6 n=1 Tax=Protopterus annectens TaxID=7888 RepID=UPI001CF9F59C|nr:LOW QUALITY PROTEIN: ubiquitin-like modifier-activating enzyme 6 [Protopterus annectens]
MTTNNIEIDDALHSHQRYVLGDGAMQKMAKSHIFLSGVGGLRVEIAKNIVLSGVKALTIHDTQICQTWDLGCNFFIHQDDIEKHKNRAEACQHRIAELNSYVEVYSMTTPLDTTTDLSFLRQYQYMVLMETKIALHKRINEFCHLQQPPIKFISADVYGIYSQLFCDFGDQFEVFDTTREKPKEIFIENITQSNPEIVTCSDSRPHRLETGQSVVLHEVNRMSSLNGTMHQVTVISPYSFSIGDTTHMDPYQHGEIAVQVKMPKIFCFESVSEQLFDPHCIIVNFSKPETLLEIYTAMWALNEFQEQSNHLPYIGCLQDAATLLKLAESVSDRLAKKPSINPCLVKWLSLTAKGFLATFAAASGGIVSQEALKAVTEKFSLLQQWLYMDSMEVTEPLEHAGNEQFLPMGDRYDALWTCIGESMCQKLYNLNVFLVGCGAIGCEMLKNFALLDIASRQDKGMIMVTDPDFIEKSNLNRQLLFGPHHIQKPKSCTAAMATLEINPELNIDAHFNKVYPATENIYSNKFYIKQNVVVTALGNVEARWYIDSRCVANQSPLLDSGTMGTKGHTEIIVLHLTESYNSHRDPPEEEIPFCTLKSFTALIEHTIQWTRDKFESVFFHKPSQYNNNI